MNRCAGMAFALVAAVSCTTGLSVGTSQAGSTGCTAVQIQQQTVPGNRLGRMTDVIKVSGVIPLKYPETASCSTSSVLSGSVATATGVRVARVTTASGGPAPNATCRTAALTTGGYRFVCKQLPTKSKVTVIYTGAAGKPAKSHAAATNNGAKAENTVMSAFDPAALWVSHALGTKAGTAVDTASLVNHGPRRLTSVKETATPSAAYVTGFSTNRAASCSWSASSLSGSLSGPPHEVCKLTYPLPVGATWRLKFHLRGQAGASDTDAVAANFNFRTPSGLSFSGKSAATVTGLLAS